MPIPALPLFRHRETVVTPADQNQFVAQFENTMDTMSNDVIPAINLAITDINGKVITATTARDEAVSAKNIAVSAKNEALTAVATLQGGAIDDTIIAPNKTFSNQYTNNNFVKLTGNQIITGAKTFSGLSKTSIGDNALEVITSNSNSSAGSFMVSQGVKYGLALNGSGTSLVTGSFIFQVIDRDSKTVQSMPFSIGINGVVSYNYFPVTPSLAPTSNYQVANKKYVDDNTLLSPNDSKVKTALNASGTAPIYACRAWVNFNGTGTVAIRASGNVSSITDNGVGYYTCNLITAMQDVNYCVDGSAIGSVNGIAFFISNDPARPNTTSSFSVNARDSGNDINDITHINLALIR